MRNPARILAVDDAPENLEILRTRLQAHGYEVITAANGEEGLARARDSEPDLVLLEVRASNCLELQCSELPR